MVESPFFIVLANFDWVKEFDCMRLISLWSVQSGNGNAHFFFTLIICSARIWALSLVSGTKLLAVKMPVIKSEKRICRSEQRSKRVSAGRCPHCRLLFQNPVALTCGHSLCALCCQELLDRRSSLTSISDDRTNIDSPKSHRPPNTTPVRTPMMGLRILSEISITTPDIFTPTRRHFSIAIRAPECPACGNAASHVSLTDLTSFALSSTFSKPQSRIMLWHKSSVWCHVANEIQTSPLIAIPCTH